MKGQGRLLTGMMLGAGTMYLLDPDRGARRRSLLRDQGMHAGRKMGEGLAATARDARNRTAGAAAELRSRFRKDEADDEIVHERVRSAIGRVVTHPSAVEVTVNEGRITLAGHVLADEVYDLLKQVGRVRGVAEVRSQLQIHQGTEGVPALQGPGHPRQHRPELLQENWSPATRLIAGLVGGALALKAGRSKGALGNLASLVGLSLVARAATNLPPDRLVGRRSSVILQKTITVAAPVDRVWDLWSHFENFPRFMTHLQEVRRIDDQRSHWVAAGPGGIPVEWDAVITAWAPHERIAWKSVEDSTISTSGTVKFKPVSDGTEIEVQISYRPPLGVAGHGVASLFGSDPKRAMDDDLVRFKSLLEEGKTRADGDQVRIEEVVARSP
jgi:uncharacterized membrane protein